MKNETILRGCLVLTILVSLWMMVMWNNDIIVINNQKNKIDNLTFDRDSLQAEIFILKVELGRHELTREEMFSRHKELEKEYNEYIEHETE
jgi:hypothetical protein